MRAQKRAACSDMFSEKRECPAILKVQFLASSPRLRGDAATICRSHGVSMLSYGRRRANILRPLGVHPWGIAVLFARGVTAMRILSKRQLKELVLYSPQHIARLEAVGRFPKRVQLGQCR